MPRMSPARPIELLLVEDNPADVRLTVEAFRDARLMSHLHVARDGVEAMNFLRKEARFEAAPTPDLILLDLNLPRMDGREVLREAKSDERLRRIPIVVITTSNSEEDIARSYDLHANSYVTKPSDYEEFAEVIRLIEGYWLDAVQLPPAAHSAL